MGQKLRLLVWNHTAKLHRVTAKDSEDHLSPLVEVEIGQHTRPLPALSTDAHHCTAPSHRPLQKAYWQKAKTSHNMAELMISTYTSMLPKCPSLLLPMPFMFSSLSAQPVAHPHGLLDLHGSTEASGATARVLHPLSPAGAWASLLRRQRVLIT